ncbi:probable disease resistance protein At4g27220 [Vicia villosa]|uniref:probable disease resistance protein At4g27220 n=1 Tax=Vicia villosa TaxID=3911 RepID=UPI00273A7615|nr:probable disease resistance protein At4g27220 [Vicia villosa]
MRLNELTKKAEKFDKMEPHRRLPDVERFTSTNYISFQSRESKYKDLLEALEDDNNYMIALQGMGGSGKTTLAKVVGRELKKNKQFAHVIATTVSFDPNTKRIQDDIAGPLGLKLDKIHESERPKKLRNRLTNGNKILLILDDVWDRVLPIDFDLIGIPKKTNHKGCRLLITTRSKRIFNIMGCDRMIELELLSEEEAWDMFKMYAGISNSSSESLITKGRQITKECKHLPVAIAVIASSLRGQQYRKHTWDATLKSLKNPVLMDDVHKEKVEIYKCLKFSYDFMKDEKAMRLFLLSSVFPKGEDIPLEFLTRLGIGTGLFGEDYGKYDDARDEVVVAKNKLIDSCLLMEVGDKYVRMHDFVREVAHWIANKEIQSVNLSNKDTKSSLEKEMNVKYLFFKGNDMDLFSSRYDGSKLGILIVDMEIVEDCKSIEVPNSFFENIGKLRVLCFLGHENQPLLVPDSIRSLANIRSILVDGVDLGDISVLGNLQSLETLDLVECKINELPHEIAMLGKLKLLNLEECEIRRNNPFEVIERCSTLEELYFIDSFNDFCGEITLPELQRYRIRKGWSVMDDSLSKYVSFEAGNDECFFSKETFKYCMQTTKGLQLNGIKEGWKNLIPEIVSNGMNDLVELRLTRISLLKCLISTIHSEVPNTLSKLVVLKLDTMENLVELFNGSISVDFLKSLKKLSIKNCKMFRRLFNCTLNFCNLRSVTLQKCPMLISLSPLLTSRNIVLLEKLKIADFEGLDNKVIDDNNKDDKSHGPMFPKLRVLDIDRCHRLESIFHSLSFQDLPALENINIKRCDELKHILGQNQHVERNSLKEINLFELPNFMSIFPRYSHSMSSRVNESSSTSRSGSKVHKKVDTIKCNIFSLTSCHGYRRKLGSISTTKTPSTHKDPLQNNSTASTSVSSSHRLQIWESVQCFQVQSSFLCNVKEITLSYISNITSVLILSFAPTMLVETLTIRNCHKLKHIIVDIEDDESADKNWGNVFPKLKMLDVRDCEQLKYVFGHYTDGHPNHHEIHFHLPALQRLELYNLPNLIAISPKQYCIRFPPIKELKITEYSKDAIKPNDEFGKYQSDSKFVHNAIMKVSISHDLQLGEPSQCLPVQSNILCNVIGITLFGISKIKSVFKISITPRLLVESLRIENCDELKQITVDIGDDKNGGNIWRNIFPKLERLCIINCMKLEYIFGNYTDDHPGHNKIPLHLPALQYLELCNLPSLVSVCPKQYCTPFPHLKELILKDCSLDTTITKFLYIWEHAQYLPLPSNIMCYIKEITLSGFSKIKSVCMLSFASRMLVETLRIEHCDELKHIIVGTGDDESGGNNRDNVFPKLETLYVQNCRKLEYIFGHYTEDHSNHNEIRLHLPALQCLRLCALPSLVAMSGKQYDVTFSPLKEFELVECSLDNTIIKDLSGSLEHFIAFESLKVHNSIAEKKNLSQ